MSIIVCIALGLVAGLIASKLVSKSGGGMLWDIILGIAGAVMGGWLFRAFGMSGVTGFNVYSVVVASTGAVVFLFIYHAFISRRV